MFSYIVSKTNRVINPANPLREGFRSYSRVMSLEQHNLKIHYLANIKIYNTGLIKDPVHDFETLKLMYELDQCLINGNKQEAIKCYTKFILNKDETKYGDDFGKAKDHIDTILHSHRTIVKISPLDILEFMGFKRENLLKKGILETTLLTTKNNVGSTTFEILVMEALPQKYDFVEKIIYCQDGAVKVKCLNLTGQSNPDYAIDIKDTVGNLIRIAYDSKAQKMDTFIKNLEIRGLNYQVVTVASTPDEFITQHSSFKLASSKYVLPKEMTQLWGERFAEKAKDSLPMMFMSTTELANHIEKNFNNNDDPDN